MVSNRIQDGNFAQDREIHHESNVCSTAMCAVHQCVQYSNVCSTAMCAAQQCVQHSSKMKEIWRLYADVPFD